MRGWRLFFAFASLLVCSAAIAFAQTTGDISGRVTDTSESPLPGVTIEATSSSLPGSRITETGPDGVYRIPAIPPGTYRVRASLPGFRPFEKTCTVALESSMTVNLTLRLETEERLLVSGDTPPIDTTSTTTGTNYTSDVIQHLPVGRNYAEIVRSNPGVSTDHGYTDGRLLPLTIYGATSAENQWIIDGVNTTNVYKGTQGKAMSSEFVQEVEIKTGGYQAEFGRALGGVINVITKSGGNVFHGDGFLYYDSTETAARQRADAQGHSNSQNYQPWRAMRTTDGTRLEYGADLGGFLLKDRLWFFAAYDRAILDGHVARTESSTYVSKDLLFPFDSTDNLYSGKITWNVAPSTTLVANAFADPSSTSGAGAADPRRGLGQIDVTPPVSPVPSTWSSTRWQGGTDYALRATKLFGSDVVATLQGSYHRDRSSLTAADEIRHHDWTCAGGTPQRRCDRPGEPNAITGGYGYIVGYDHNHSSRQQYSAAATMYARTHEIKVGGDYMEGRPDLTFSWTGQQQADLWNEYGQTYYRHRFFAVSPADPTPVPNLRIRAQVLNYGAYIQDSWKASPGLTVNLGLRWDGEMTRNHAGQTVFRTADEWQPRIGVVWDPRGDGAMKVYASAGRFSYALPTAATTSLFYGGVTQLTTYNFDPVSVLQDSNVINHGRATGGMSAPFGVPADEDLEGYSQNELIVGLERLLAPGLTVGLKGTYRSLNDAVELRADFDYNSPLTNYSSYAIINPGSNGTFASGNMPTCDGFWEAPEGSQCFATGPATPAPRRIYRGLELLARQSIRDGLWIQASYTYSSLRGNYDGGVNEQFYGNTSPGVTGAFYNEPSWHNGYGTLALDRPHRFRLDGYWVTPLRLSVGLQAFAESGAPLNRLGYYGCCGAMVFLDPRGSAGRLPTFWEGNLTLSYPIAIGPVTTSLHAYVFNVFDNQIETSRDEGWTTDVPEGYPATIYDPDQVRNNLNYGGVTGRSAPRSFRAAVRVAF
jgi:outer membrane receptor protein involved in Fe transport